MSKSSAFTLNHHLLLASPGIKGDDFARGVVLLTKHREDQGAVGLLLNKPLGHRVGEIISDPELKKLGDLPVFVGGPVERQQLSLVSVLWSEKHGRLQCESDISARRALEMREEGWKILAFAGYSGWSPGQLEKELKQDSWFVRPPSESILEEIAPEMLWKTLLQEMGPIFSLISESPDEPHLN